MRRSSIRSIERTTGVHRDTIMVFGRLDFDLISTSYVERLSATTRLHAKRLAV
jgi:hypothetical protein